MTTIKIGNRDIRIKFTNRTLHEFCEINGSLEMIEVNAFKKGNIGITVDLLWAGSKNMNNGLSKEDLWNLIDEKPIDDLYEELMKELNEVGFIKSSSKEMKNDQKDMPKPTPEEMEMAKALLF